MRFRFYLFIFCLHVFLCLTGNLTAQSNPVPFVDAPLVPTSAAPGGPGFTLTVNGANFVAGSVVMWNGSARTTHFVRAAELTASISPSDIIKTGTATVTVVNPGAPASNVAFFSVVAPVASVAFSGATLPISGNAQAVVAADFNGDGVLDLAVPLVSLGTVAILLGNGDGTFQPPVSYPSNDGPSGLVNGDFNGDGVQDLAVINEFSNQVSILLGKGDGSFAAPVSYPTGGFPFVVLTGDFNRDGKLDLVVLSEDSDVVSVFLGRGDGTFQVRPTFSAKARDAMCVGDFNGDGILDLAISDAGLGSGIVQILLGKGDGTFTSLGEYPAGENLSFGLAASDVNGDGILDLIVASYDGTRVLLGNGDGSVGPATTYSGPGNSLAVTDLNGDGKPDIVVISGNTTAVLLGNGDGSFQAASNFEAGVSPQDVTFGDFNGDGAMDLAMGDFDSTYGGVFVSLQTNGSAVLISPLSLTFPLQLFKTPSTPQTIQVSNVGKETLVISKIIVQGAAHGDFVQTNNCKSGVAAGSSCNIHVTFVPQAKGPRSAALVISDNALAPVQSIPLSGGGTWVSLSPASLNFGNQKVGTVSPPQTVTLKNVGTGPVTVEAIQVAGLWQKHEYNLTDNCSTVAAGSSCTINITFAPTRKATADASLLVHHDGGGRTQGVSLTGTGT